MMFSFFSSSSRNTGAVLPTIAVFIVLGLSVVGFVLYASSIGAVREQVRGNVRLIALAAVQGYFEHDCQSSRDVEACHAAKKSAALQRAQDVLSTSPEVLNGLDLVYKEEQSDDVNEALLSDGRWFFVAPSDVNFDPCNGDYPCRVNRQENELANCFTVEGKLNNSWTNLFGRYFGSHLWSSPVSFHVTASGVPVRFAFATDISASMAEDNFPRPLPEQFDNGGDYDKSQDIYRLDDGTFKVVNYSTGDAQGVDGQQVPVGRSAPVGRSNNLAPQSRSVGPPPEEAPPEEGGNNGVDETEQLLPYGAYFALQTNDLYQDPLDAVAVPDEVQIVWSDLPNQRKDLPLLDATKPNIWTKDDYEAVVMLGVGEGSYDTYCANNGSSDCPHLAPKELGGLIFDPPPDDNGSTEYADFKIPMLINTFRDANHTSAQPWLSVMEALDEVVTAIEARQVPGDKVGLLFFDSQVYWSRAIRLTDNFDYIHSVLDLPSMRGEVSFNQGDPPRWVQLGLFPSAAMYTDALVGLKGAFEMIALADDKVPAINNIIMITDGLSTCRPNPYGCDSSYEFYSDSMLALRNLTEKQIFSEKIALHVIQAGQQALPHFLGVQQSGENEETGNGECLTDEMARLKGWQLVRGEDPPIDNYYMGQEAWVNRFDGGFPQATADWHALATTTGGVYVPVRPVVANCTPADPDTFCDSFTTNYKVASRITTDPYCRNTRDQVSSAMIEKILKDSIAKSFTVVETEGS